MKRALLIGINYVGTQNELRGCINDINNIAAYLQSARGYPSASCIVLSDVATRKPTRANILAAFKELLQGVRAGDELWFHYSGHGALQRDTNGDEESGADSCICPIDYNQAGLITDDAIRSELAALVPAGARLFMVLDMCHSGTGCDLRYKFDDTSYMLNAAAPMPSTYDPNAWSLRQTSYEFKNYVKTAGEVFCISGCQDTQTSADAYIAGQAAGALTYSLLQSLKANNPATYKWKHLLKDVCCWERVGQFSQRTSLTCGQPLNLENGVFAPMVVPAPAPAPAPPVVVPAPAAPFVLPQWVNVYLLQLQRLRLPVPQWVMMYIQQLRAQHYLKQQKQQGRSLNNTQSSNHASNSNGRIHLMFRR
jgi:hypothetical protein